MMDCVAYEAPLDSSFQKDRLELVNKGSLGRRRKPSRANLKLLLSPSPKTRDPDHLPSLSRKSTSPKTPAKKITSNGDVSWRKAVAQNNQRSLRNEPGLSRTPPEPNLASEAQQFSIQAKLKRKNSDLGRSAVLIRTWERRTHSESFSKKQQTPVNRNRFLDKENVAANPPAMPDSYICPRYKGSLQNGDSKRDGGLVRSIRGTFYDEKSFRAGKQNGSKSLNGKTNGIDEKEPEWISLSRKLCAKFVEGHIDSHSTNSCEHQELNGVDKVGNTFPEINGMKRKELQYVKEETKKKAVEVPSVEHTQNDEPPWVPLSRKLCTKFIEEHIEYPASVCCHSEKPADILEPNGDVRIIERIGNPKSNKKKAKKESEPEWISLSRKLRAKFIESHIDDPDTIALDNQLNASDPEETSSESLSDTSQEISIQKVECQLTNHSSRHGTSGEEWHQNFSCPSSIQRPANQINESFFQEKECCWEYQEMEFDQESNSGTFQDAEYYGDGTQNGGSPSEEMKTDVESQRTKNFQNFEVPDSDFKNRISFADLEKSKSLQKTGNESNDVIFLPRSKEESNRSSNSQEKKIITVQFIAHPESVQRKRDTAKKAEAQNDTHSPFFNLTTWEEAHYVSDREQVATNQNSSLENSFKKDFRSKSLDDLCDSKEEIFFVEDSKTDAVEEVNSDQFCTSGFKIKLLCKSEEFLNKDTCPKPTTASNNDKVEDDFTNNWTTKHEDGPNDEIQNDIENQSPKIESRSPLEFNDHTTSNNKLPKEKKQLNVKKSEMAQTDLENFSKPKCNGVIPNTRNNDSKGETSKLSNSIELNGPELQRPGMSKWVNFTKAKNASKNEYANIDSQKTAKPNGDVRHKPKHKAKESTEEKRQDKSSKNYGKIFSKKEHEDQSKEEVSNYTISNKTETYNQNEMHGIRDDNMNYEHEKTKRRQKSKSLCDLSYDSNAFVAKSSELDNHIDSKRRSIADIPIVIVQDSNSPMVEFQDFAEESEIPLCAKLVSKQNKKNTSNRNTPSISSSSIRNESPCSETSHVYEDMFKETSCPSDSEASSWSVMKKNSYYVNGRSSSMNDLDLSDSCSLSIKCDYASSCSGQSTLQSRHSSCGSSSFYVNLRDYDSHMLEPSLIRRRKERSKTQSNGKVKITNSNPPTPESLRHLFTSPLSSVHTPTNGTSRLLSRLPPDSQSHYYSSASATSSAFKHGFDLTPPKPKKTERSSSIKIKDIAHGIILTFRRLQNHSKNSHVSPTHYVDVSHLAQHGSKTSMNADFEKGKSKKSQKEFIKNQDLERNQWSKSSENGRTDSDSGYNLPDVSRAKARRSSSDSTGMKSKFDMLNSDKKKNKNGKLKLRDKGKKSRSKTTETRTIPTVSRKVQQMADGTLYLVTTVSGDTALPGVYSDSPDTSSELSTHRPVKVTGESNC